MIIKLDIPTEDLLRGIKYEPGFSVDDTNLTDEEKAQLFAVWMAARKLDYYKLKEEKDKVTIAPTTISIVP
jgi:hypothetical protein